MDGRFDPIILRYEGLEADNHVIDLAQLGASIQGASRLLGSAGTIALTGNFAKQHQALSVRVLAGTQQAHCYEFAAILVTLSPMAVPMLPVIRETAKNVATKAVTGIVNYALARFSGRKTESENVRDIAVKALGEMGHTSRTVVESMERMVASQRPAAKLFVMPVGQSCSLATLGSPSNGAIALDKPSRDAIDAAGPIEITNLAPVEILLSELDLKNRSCKFSLRNEEDQDRRFNGEISDPIIQLPHNPYSKALDDQTWLQVMAKAQLREGELERLYISDLVAPPPS